MSKKAVIKKRAVSSKKASKKKSVTKKPSKKKVAWKAIDHAIYSDVIEHLVHFSSRPVNTNAATVGIRIVGKPLDLPYLSVSTVGPKNVDTDYFRNAGKEASPYKQIRAVLNDTLSDFDSSNSLPIDAAHIKSEIAKYSKKPFEQTDVIDPRLRQVLWPIGSDDYVAITPLASAGLSLKISERITLENKKGKELDENGWGYRRSRLPIGGSNPQNAGGLVYMMTSPLITRAPAEEADTKKAYSLYYNGLRYNNLHAEIKEFALWYTDNRNASKKSTVYLRRHADRLLRAIAYRLIAQASNAQQLILSLELDEHCDRDLPTVQQGLLDNSKRSVLWRKELSMDLARYVADYHPYIEGEVVSLGINDSDLGTMATIFSEAIR